MKQRSKGRGMQLVAGCAALACIAAVGNVQATEVHRWVDENGVVHFSDIRPESAPATTLELTEPAPAPVPAPGDTGGATEEAGEPLSAAEQQRRQIRERREARAAEREEAEYGCDRHRTRLEQMEPARRVFYTDENGEQVRMDDDMRVGLIEESKSFLSENCQ